MDDEDWASDNALAAALIFSCCDLTQKQYILNSRDAKRSLGTLAAVHKTPSKQRLATLIRQFHRFEAEDKTIDESVIYLNGRQANIRSINEELASSRLCKGNHFTLLPGLSKEYETIVTISWSTFDDVTVDFNAIAARLREEELRRGKGGSKNNALL